MVSATPSSHTEVLLTWSRPESGDVREFRIERADASGAFVQIATVSADVLSYRDVGLSPATAYNYRVRACGDGGCSPYTNANTTTLTQLVITSQTLPDGVRGEPYNGAITATGGAGGYTWTVLSGSLPAGLTLSEVGVLSGIPLTAQTSLFVARVRSQDGQVAQKDLSIRVVEPAPGSGVTIQTSRLPPALLGLPYEPELDASGGNGSVYTWSLVSGAVPPGVTLAEGGLFSGTPTTPGSFSFTVRVTSGGRSAQQAYTVTVVSNDVTRFNITSFEVATVPANIRPHLEAAIARWERVISGDLSVLRVPRSFFGTNNCDGFGKLVNGTAVDDVIVMMDISPIDGAGKVLGQAGPCGIRNDRLPFAGVLTLDSDDLTPLVGARTLTDIIFHEIGHILGFGTLWGSSVLTGGGTSDPRDAGANAVQRYQALGGTGSVPLENTGGVGTADAHWRESVFRTEIMTGFSERIGVAMPMSVISIAAMADLGYTVNFAEADPYALPSLAAAPEPTPREPLGYDMILPGPVLTLPSSGVPR
jgi:hypothetical protein